MALEDRNRLVRHDAISKLSNLGDEKAVEPLIKKLRCDRVGFVRFFAGFALFEIVYYRRIDSRRIVEPLIKALKGMSPSERILEEVIETFQTFAISIYATDSEFDYFFEYICNALEELKAIDRKKHRDFIIHHLRRSLENSWFAKDEKISVKERITKLMHYFDTAI